MSELTAVSKMVLVPFEKYERLKGLLAHPKTTQDSTDKSAEQVKNKGVSNDALHNEDDDDTPGSTGGNGGGGGGGGVSVGGRGEGGGVDGVETIPTPVHGMLTVDNIVQGISKPFRTKARSLLNFIKHSGSGIDWAAQGELVIDGTAVPGSNIISLVRHTMKHYVRFKPVGTHAFYKALMALNVPPGLIGNPDALKHVHPPGAPVAPPGVKKKNSGRAQRGWIRLKI